MMENSENTWDKLLQVTTCGRDDLHADQYHHPYEPTPYCVLERLADRGFFGKSDVVLDCIHDSKVPLKFRVITYPKEHVNIKFFKPLPYTYYLENRKEFSILTHDLIQEQIDIYKKGEK